MEKIYGYPILTLRYDNKLFSCKKIVDTLREFFRKNKNLTLNDITKLNDEQLRCKLCLLSNGYFDFNSFESHFYSQNKILYESLLNGKYTYNGQDVYVEYVYLGFRPCKSDDIVVYYRHNVCNTAAKLFYLYSNGSQNCYIQCKKCNIFKLFDKSDPSKNDNVIGINMIHPVLSSEK